MWKKINFAILSCVIALGLNVGVYAEDIFNDEIFDEEIYDQDQEANQDAEYEDQVSIQALNDYNPSGSLFEKITALEQEKVVIQLQKERAQLDLELERLNAERIKLQMELDTLSGRAEQQQHELEAAKTQLEIQTEKLRKQKDSIDEEVNNYEAPRTQPARKTETDLSGRYRLINVVGVDNQLQATVSEIATGQNKRIAVGKQLDGYTVKSISLNDGIIFEKDGETESLNIGK
ncbi:MAG: hypothetical protein IKZ49_00790 [Alphaproteobacteria bacterium]|nr:hypothetical protein [Alphaproteobacteria bacterium]